MSSISKGLLSIIEFHSSSYNVKIRNDYSGRFMMGSTCFALVGDCDDIYSVLSNSMIDSVETDRDLLQEMESLMCNMRQDDIGFDSVFYFPGYSLKEAENEFVA